MEKDIEKQQVTITDLVYPNPTIKESLQQIAKSAISAVNRKIDSQFYEAILKIDPEFTLGKEEKRLFKRFLVKHYSNRIELWYSDGSVEGIMISRFIIPSKKDMINEVFRK